MEKNVAILLIEDDPGHARLIEKNLRRIHIRNEIVTLSNGREALDFIFSQGRYTGIPCSLPLLIILDLNLPEIDGYQVLERIKTNEQSRHVPVIVLTTTENPSEISRCYRLGCNVFISKPVDYKKFINAISKLGLFLTIVSVPDNSHYLRSQ